MSKTVDVSPFVERMERPNNIPALLRDEFFGKPGKDRGSSVITLPRKVVVMLLSL